MKDQQQIIESAAKAHRKNSLDTMMAAGAGTYKIRLEAVRVFRSELLLDLLKTRAEGRSLDADDFGNGLVGQPLLAEPPDFLCLRHQLVQTGKELVELCFIADNIFYRRCIVGESIQRRARVTVFILSRIIEGDVVACTTEFTVQAVGVAEPELVFRAGALAVGLMTLTESVVKTSVLHVDFFGYFHPFTGGFEINTVGLTLI